MHTHLFVPQVSQIDVLKALDYRVFEATPGQFIDEIWNCLPTLRKVLAFPDGWTTAQTNAWLRLNTAVVGASHILHQKLRLVTHQ